MVQVVGVGFLRTGTTSLKQGLERLGFGPCYHMRVLNAEPWRAADWVAAAENPASADWDAIFAGYESTVGSPGTAFWREIVDAYPAAKVILTVRDPQAWYDSAAGTISPGLEPSTLSRLLARCRRRRRNYLDEVQRFARDYESGGRFADRAHAVAAFERHVDAVRAHVPADRLLIFDVRDGWGPLCSFLGVPEPAEPFPRENDRASFRRRQRQALVRVVVRRASVATAAGTVVTLAVLAVKSRRPRRVRPAR